jgi:hypothetical protein
MFASGCGKASVGEYGILLEYEKVFVSRVNKEFLREHQMQRNAKSLSTVYVSKAGRIRNDCICNER